MDCDEGARLVDEERMSLPMHLPALVFRSDRGFWPNMKPEDLIKQNKIDYNRTD